ncbi:GTPase-associated system all-helical protein GASH [Marinobacter sp.]|uniref:GTPase-associated system all-helical protein GASH n=1 Tax=Marinobacter sp. TaxID=50741 RepID=UPI0034A14D25
MLQDLLNCGLVDIGSEDSRFAKMESAAGRLSKQIEESPSLLITAALIALDENVGEDDPFFERVESLVIEEWNTLRNTHVNRPRELLRSITVSALVTATNENPERSAIVWNTAASRLSHDQTSLGKAADLLTQCFKKVFSTAEIEALRRAGMLELAPTKRRSRKSTGSAPEAPKLSGSIKTEELKQDVARAVGPQNQEGQGLDDPNPQWPNQGQPWSYQFTPRMTEALVKAVNLGTSRLAKSIAAEIATHITAIEQHLQKQLGQVESLQSKLAEAEIAGRMRLDVLWWSQARYSSSQNAAYSALPAATAAISAAVDLTAMVPALAPTSVAHVLGETMAACTQNESLTLLNHLGNLRESRPVGLKEAVPTGDTNAGRVPLLQIVTEASSGESISEDDLRSRVGVDPELMLDASELAMWLFRELQAQRIAAGAA